MPLAENKDSLIILLPNSIQCKCSSVIILMHDMYCSIKCCLLVQFKLVYMFMCILVFPYSSECTLAVTIIIQRESIICICPKLLTSSQEMHM